MNFRICAAAVAASLTCAATNSAVAANNKPANNLRAVQIECMKQYGAWEDPQTHRLQFTGSITDMQSRSDAIYACVSQKTGKPTTPFLQEQLRWQ